EVRGLPRGVDRPEQALRFPKASTLAPGKACGAAGSVNIVPNWHWARDALQQATLTATGEAPFGMAATATTTTAIVTKIKASGNQRSAHAVNPIAIRTRARSCFVEPPEDAAVIVASCIRPQ